MIKTSSLFAIIALAAQCNGLYFHIYRNEKKCFIEEMPEDTIFHGIYDVKISQPGTQNFVETPSGFGMYVEVTNEEGKSVLSRSYGAEGKFTVN